MQILLRFSGMIVVVLVFLSLTLACAPVIAPTPTPAPMAAGGMDMSGMGTAPAIPAGLAFAEGEEIRFIHTEVSDAEIGKLLSGMMNSPVLVVPSLAQVPEGATAPVYVFTNGPKGTGPLGFQPDVFPNPPGTDGYTPLRAIHLVTWADTSQPRELKSAAQVLDAEKKGEVKIDKPGVIVNMPFITWSGGSR